MLIYGAVGLSSLLQHCLDFCRPDRLSCIAINIFKCQFIAEFLFDFQYIQLKMIIDEVVPFVFRNKLLSKLGFFSGLFCKVCH